MSTTLANMATMAAAEASRFHTPFVIREPPGWVLYVSHSERPVRRLLVFVHGFMGNAVRTWQRFPIAGSDREWWEASDMLFVGYRSTRENITGVANYLREQLPKFYPEPYSTAMMVDGNGARTEVSPYEELFLIGHSLGGLIARRALCDAALKWKEAPNTPRPAILDAQLRLFSPASQGFRGAGLLGLLRATSKWNAVEMFIRPSSAYQDLQPDSPTLRKTQERTEVLVNGGGFDMLKARIVWANPDNVVTPERYDTDWVDGSWNGKTHSSVCKPQYGTFDKPWDFVETGSS